MSVLVRVLPAPETRHALGERAIQDWRTGVGRFEIGHPGGLIHRGSPRQESARVD